MPPQKKLISQQEFAAKLREKIPELKDYNDNQIVAKILEKRPDLIDKIENPMSGDMAASREQNRLQGISPNALVSPEFWQNHPNMAGLAKGGLDLLPGVGAMAGGALATPETLGLGTVGGAVIGTGAGRGLRDVLAEGLGLENSSPLQKGMNMGGDMALSGIVPAAINMVRSPVDAARAAARGVDSITPKISKWLKPQIWDDFIAEKPPYVEPYRGPKGFPTEPTPPKTDLTAYPPDPNRMPRQESLFPANPNRPMQLDMSVQSHGDPIPPPMEVPGDVWNPESVSNPYNPYPQLSKEDNARRLLKVLSDVKGIIPKNVTPEMDKIISDAKPVGKIKLSAQGNTITNKETGEIVHQSTSPKIDLTEKTVPKELQSPTNVSPKFNPKGTKGMTGTSKSLDDIINELIMPKIEEE